MLQNLPIMPSESSFFNAHYSQYHAHSSYILQIMLIYYDTVIIIIYACKSHFRNIDSPLTVFRVGGCSIRINHPYTKVTGYSIL